MTEHGVHREVKRCLRCQRTEIDLLRYHLRRDSVDRSFWMCTDHNLDIEELIQASATRVRRKSVTALTDLSKLTPSPALEARGGGTPPKPARRRAKKDPGPDPNPKPKK